MYAMGDPFTADYQLGVCCTFAVGTKGHVRPWLRSLAQYGVLGVQFWFLAISGTGKVSLTTVCEWVDGRANCTGMYGSLSWFSGSALWHNSSINRYIESLFIYVYF